MTGETCKAPLVLIFSDPFFSFSYYANGTEAILYIWKMSLSINMITKCWKTKIFQLSLDSKHPVTYRIHWQKLRLHGCGFRRNTLSKRVTQIQIIITSSITLFQFTNTFLIHHFWIIHMLWCSFIVLLPKKFFYVEILRCCTSNKTETIY